MRVAILSPVAWRTPPRHYGPWEQMASNLTEGLVKLGIDVTLFATGDSITSAQLDAVIPIGYEEDRSIDAKVVECLHISNVMEKASQFDLIHNHFDFLPLSYSRLIQTPMITTIHGFSSSRILPVYEKYNANTHYVSISDADRSSKLAYLATVYNGSKLSDFDFNENPEDYLLFFGRIHPDKGTAEAIAIAQHSKKKLVIAGIIQDQGYFDDQVKPHLNEQIEFVGPADAVLRKQLLAQASALLHPITFDEPFGLSVAEAMLCGTPVIAFNRGSMPELVRDGATGYLVHHVNEAVEAVKDLYRIKRTDCRIWAEERFSQEQMALGYLNCYRQILNKV